jgi:DNA-binding transcriptional MerR regulator
VRIGQLAKRLGVAASKLRFLEAQGLIEPARRLPSGYRDYDESVIETVQIILQAQSFGFTLEEISRSFVEAKGQTLRCDYVIKRLSAKRQELDRHIEQAQAMRLRLSNAIAEFEKRRAANQKVEARMQTHLPLPQARVPASGKPPRGVRGMAR